MAFFPPLHCVELELQRTFIPCMSQDGAYIHIILCGSSLCMAGDISEYIAVSLHRYCSWLPAGLHMLAEPSVCLAGLPTDFVRYLSETLEERCKKNQVLRDCIGHKETWKKRYFVQVIPSSFRAYRHAAAYASQSRHMTCCEVSNCFGMLLLMRC